MAKTLSIIIPYYNEAENLPNIFREVMSVYEADLQSFQLEIIFMDNHSVDNSYEVAETICTTHPEIRTKIVRLSRNFGYQANILAGLIHCTGDAAVQLDADGEDDPALIPLLVKHWIDGNKVVYGIRNKRHEGVIISLQRKVFYRLINYLSSIQIPLDAGDFRLLDRQVIEIIKSFDESNPYLRGLIAYAGFNQIGIPYDRRPRFRGESKFSWWEYLQLALDGITSFSHKPLNIAVWLGFTFSLASFFAVLFYIWLYLFFGIGVPGFTTLILVHLFLAGIQLLFLGVLGTYIGRIFDQVKRRPVSIVESIRISPENADPRD